MQLSKLVVGKPHRLLFYTLPSVDAGSSWQPHDGTVGSSAEPHVSCRQPIDVNRTQLMTLTTVKKKTHFMAQRNETADQDLRNCLLHLCCKQQLLDNLLRRIGNGPESLYMPRPAHLLHSQPSFMQPLDMK